MVRRGIFVTRVAIVEDDRACARQLEECVRRYLKENGLDGEIVVFPDGMDIAEDYRPVWGHHPHGH